MSFECLNVCGQSYVTHPLSVMVIQIRDSRSQDLLSLSNVVVYESCSVCIHF
jgi:hypothetical protein